MRSRVLAEAASKTMAHRNHPALSVWDVETVPLGASMASRPSIWLNQARASLRFQRDQVFAGAGGQRLTWTLKV